MSSRMVKRRRPQWHLGMSALLLAATLAAVVVLNWPQHIPHSEKLLADLPFPSTVDLFAASLRIHDRVDSVLADLGIWSDLISKVHRDSAGIALWEIDIRIPRDLPIASVNLALTQLVRAEGGRVYRAVEKNPAFVHMEYGVDSLHTTQVRLRHEKRLSRRAGLIAVVLDDFGHASWTDELAERFCAIPQPLTLALLPNEGSAADLSALVSRHGHEVILHLPMEPLDPNVNPGRDAVLVGQEAETIRRRVRDALLRVPNAVGVNNHMGSRAITDLRVMGEVLRELRDHKLFFLDSRTTAESLGIALGSALEVPVAQRDLFIDSANANVGDVEDKLWQLAAIAQEQGQAIGIGHDREETLLALESTLPRLESRGFRFVPVSHLTQ